MEVIKKIVGYIKILLNIYNLIFPAELKQIIFPAFDG